ncbi:MAG: type IV pilin protein [Pseudomonadota bacterium]
MTHRLPPLRAVRGFTLIELMIVLAIIAIITAIAYPSYQNHVLRTRRANAAACLQEMAQQMERRYTTQMSYNSPTSALPTLACANELNGIYSFAFASGQPTATTFNIVATPQGAQTADTRCGALALNQRGEKFAQETDQTASLVAACWR